MYYLFTHSCMVPSYIVSIILYYIISTKIFEPIALIKTTFINLVLFLKLPLFFAQVSIAKFGHRVSLSNEKMKESHNSGLKTYIISSLFTIKNGDSQTDKPENRHASSSPSNFSWIIIQMMLQSFSYLHFSISFKTQPLHPYYPIFILDLSFWFQSSVSAHLWRRLCVGPITWQNSRMPVSTNLSSSIRVG